MQKDKIAHLCSLVGAIVATGACLWFFLPRSIPDLALHATFLEKLPVFMIMGLHVLLAFVIGYTARLILVHAIAWYLMTSDEYYFFRRWFFYID